ncbi:hypothetical protein HC031_27840 [Planosporangium thailandense]|uniref:DUF5655 domain-containing protein n=1 Tax=Planosporangium thailandense TaxID=765197 RepID=A0ABX0Y7V8_9ACTN|nr:DUF5655 domain-containing protein [Planosporangium thailandense]NJC73508.1 hypothetical protein [Planosporangium thailandense]
MPDADGRWTVEDHLRGAPVEYVELYRAVEAAIHACGPVIVSPSKTTITFKGSRRGFVGARPTRRGVRGYLDLTRSLVGDRRILSSSPYTGRLHVNQYRLTTLADLDDTFISWLQEAYRVGQGDHLHG